MSSLFHHEAVYNRAIKTYGARLQLVVAIEEMSELTKELCKCLREKDEINKIDKELWKNICEEIADTQIMLDQLIIIFKASDEVALTKWDKLHRLEYRLAKLKLEEGEQRQ